jgi:hypothetical protein
MMAFPYRITAICPVAVVPVLRLVGAMLGHGPGTFCAPLSPTGAAPATHYAASTVSRGDFMGLVTTDAASREAFLGSVDWAAHGMTEQAVRGALALMREGDPPIMITGPATDRGADHLGRLCAAHGLLRVAFEHSRDPV